MKTYIDSYDELFMNMAYLAAMKSKDIKTHVGAVIVGPDNEVRSLGFNSFPRGINDNVSERQERPEKYNWFAHAERNAIYNSSRVGIGLKNCRLYVTSMPCSDCAIAIIQSGINEVIVDYDESIIKDSEKYFRTLTMFKEANIIIRYLKTELVQIIRFKDGEVI